MLGLTIGLAGVSAAFVTQAVAEGRFGQFFWAVATCAALVVFLGNPRPFNQVTVWAVASVVVWFIANGGANKPAILCGGVAGFLIGSAAPYLAFALADGFAVLPELSTVLVGLGSACAGLLLTGVWGGAMAVLAAALPLGLYAQPATAVALILGVWLSLILSLRSGRAATALLMFLPFLGFLRGLE